MAVTSDPSLFKSHPFKVYLLGRAHPVAASDNLIEAERDAERRSKKAKELGVQAVYHAR